jgi:ABC-type sugar transport system permease subunit
MPSRRLPISFERQSMPVRLRKFIGTILIVVLVLFYALLANTIAVATLGDAPWWGHLLYFALSGLLWVLPAMVIIKWMAGPKQQ